MSALSPTPSPNPSPAEPAPPMQTARGERLARAVVGWVYRAPYLTLLLCALLTLSAAWGASGLKLKTKIQDLLPASAPSLKASEALSERLGSVDMLVVTLMSEELERVREALPEVAKELEALPNVRAVRWRQETEMIEKNALITFASLDELKTAYRELSAEIRDRVSSSLSLFDDEPEQADEGAENAEPPSLSPPLEELGETGKALVWAEWEGREQLSELGRSFRAGESDYPEYFYNSAYNTLGLKVFPTRSSSDIAFCEQIVADVEAATRRAVERALGPISAEGVVKRVDLGGSYKHLLKEAKKVQGDMLTSTLASFALLGLVLMIAFRSARAFFCVMLPLVMGTVWTMGLTALFVGSINLITAFIFAVLLGLGIDFGIHFYGRYREELALGRDDQEAMVHTHLSCGHASLLAQALPSPPFWPSPSPTLKASASLVALPRWAWRAVSWRSLWCCPRWPSRGRGGLPSSSTATALSGRPRGLDLPSP